jgi:hypothetical protein
MSENQNQDFEKLQQLLKLKRYEQPHPRYFNELSSQVTARLRAGETAHFEEAVSQAPWLRRFWSIIEGRPALSGIFASGICGLVLLGGFMGGKPGLQPGLAETKPEPAANQSLLADTGSGVISGTTSTNPSALSPAGNSLFSLPLGPGAQAPQPVNLRPNP